MSARWAIFVAWWFVSSSQRAPPARHLLDDQDQRQADRDHEDDRSLDHRSTSRRMSPRACTVAPGDDGSCSDSERPRARDYQPQAIVTDRAIVPAR
jgi:hypothetical protein